METSPSKKPFSAKSQDAGIVFYFTTQILYQHRIQDFRSKIMYVHVEIILLNFAKSYVCRQEIQKKPTHLLQTPTHRRLKTIIIADDLAMRRKFIATTIMQMEMVDNTSRGLLLVLKIRSSIQRNGICSKKYFSLLPF